MPGDRRRSARTSDDLLLLARALGRSGRPESRLAAGKLRTVSRWTSLPRIYGADSDAIPVTPAEPGEDTTPPAFRASAPRLGPVPTPVSAGDPTPELALPDRPPVKPVRRVLIDLVLVASALVAFLASFTVAAATQMTAVSAHTGMSGTARASSCTRSGPVSQFGFGYWYSCTAVVTWSDGQRQTVHTRTSVLTADDVGRDVAVRQLTSGKSKQPRVIRADDPPTVWGVFGSVPLFLLACLLLVRPGADVIRLGRVLARRRGTR